MLVPAMVLDDRTADFLLQVRQAMVASGSPAASTPLPLEEVAAAVEASGFSAALNDMAAATLSSSVSVFVFFSSFLILFSSLGQSLCWISIFILSDCCVNFLYILAVFLVGVVFVR